MKINYMAVIFFVTQTIRVLLSNLEENAKVRFPFKVIIEVITHLDSVFVQL